ncbi:MAG TPA: aminoglycoside phosphotransferase family protein [Ktedonobacteraceae bacterium]|nr:aminoglycoside phosphotransferase family protein [Ktedonobacteraceae bacterium]
MRQQPAIPEELLRACLQDQYDLYPVTLEFLPRGLDYNAGVYRVVSEQTAVYPAYLLKATTRPLYEPRCLVPRYLNDQEIASVVAPIPTRSGALWTRLGNWTVNVYPFIEGNTSLTGMTDEQWREVGSIFRQIHQVALPPLGFETLYKETFDPTEYARRIGYIETKFILEPKPESAAQRAFRADWQAHQSMIHTGVTTLETLAGELQRRAGPYVICHADLHPANLLRDSAGRVFVIDWDEVMLAPKERDFIFVRQPQANAFWQGYGQQEIDWVALTYYLWERVVQDVIEDANNVCFRDDWAEENRANVAQVFHGYLADGDTIKAAHQASARLAKTL